MSPYYYYVDLFSTKGKENGYFGHFYSLVTVKKNSEIAQGFICSTMEHSGSRESMAKVFIWALVPKLNTDEVYASSYQNMQECQAGRLSCPWQRGECLLSTDNGNASFGFLEQEEDGTGPRTYFGGCIVIWTGSNELEEVVKAPGNTCDIDWRKGGSGTSGSPSACSGSSVPPRYVSGCIPIHPLVNYQG